MTQVTPPGTDPAAATTSTAPAATDAPATAAQDESKAAATATAAVLKPEDLKAPEGFELPAPVIEKFLPFATERGLDAAAAQQWVDFYAKEIAPAQAQQAQAQWLQQGEDWYSQVKDDPEIGKDHWPETQLTTVRVVEHLAKALGKEHGATFVEMMEGPLGNNPVFTRVWRAVGKLISEPERGGTQQGGGAPADPDAVYRKLYPTMYDANGNFKG